MSVTSKYQVKYLAMDHFGSCLSHNIIQFLSSMNMSFSSTLQNIVHLFSHLASFCQKKRKESGPERC